MITKLLNTLSLFFGVSKSEVRGMILLLLFCVFLLVVPFVQKAIYASQKQTFRIIVDTNITISIAKHDATRPVDLQVIGAAALRNLKNRVPINTIAKEQLDSIGVSKKLVHNICKYLEKGGRFRKPQDLNKIYGMDEKTASHLAQNTLWEMDRPVAATRAKETMSYAVQTPKVETKIDINTADSVTLESLRGIGHTLALRIIKYRDRLGGFVSLDQLKEVYGISEFALEEIFKKSFIAKDFRPRYLKINQIKPENLSAHPYIGYKKSKVILNYLKNHSKLADFEDFRKSYPFTEKELGFIKNYITYE